MKYYTLVLCTVLYVFYPLYYEPRAARTKFYYSSTYSIEVHSMYAKLYALYYKPRAAQREIHYNLVYSTKLKSQKVCVVKSGSQPREKFV